MSALLEVEDVSVGYGARTVIDSLSLQISSGCFACLLGPSGCGKTTMLRAIAGFEPLRQGEMRLAGRTVSCRGVSVPPEERGIGMVFQENTLFPHLTVEGNIAFGLRGHSPQSIKRRVAELLNLVGLPDIADSYPHQLSGGQQQRVALARAVVNRPFVLLADEPTANLDPRTSEEIIVIIRKINEEGTAVVLATHKMELVMNSGERYIRIDYGTIVEDWVDPLRGVK